MITQFQRSLPKRAFLRILTLPGLPQLLSGLTRTEATIFMLHRFAVPELGVEGHDPEVLRVALADLRRRGYSFIALEDLFRRLRAGERLKRAVAFTIDDGYFDQARIAGPVFAEFDCPVTVFVVTDFLDGRTWLWWDKLAYIFDRTRRSEIRARLGGEFFDFRLEGGARRQAYGTLNFRCQEAPEADRQACIQELSVQADVELPEACPARFAPLSWAEARDGEQRGMTFGPHTLTHPTLSTTTDERSEREITESWRRLCAEVNRPVPVFCYPAGGPNDFGDREIATIRRMGLPGAVSTLPSNVRLSLLRNRADGWYSVPRHGYQGTLPDALQCVSGVEDLKSTMRRWLRRDASGA
jgi:peptidoglycan/xylan/chitin deacetylase (PgdA/CDA1 family)